MTVTTAMTTMIAHQFLDQLQSDVRSAVFGNVGTLIAFRIGSHDAPLLTEHLDDTPPHQLTELPNGEVCARLLSDGIPETFFASTIDLAYFNVIGWGCFC